MFRLFYFYGMKQEIYDLFKKSAGICTDSRQLFKNCLYVCLRGANFNGNRFAAEALEQGALHVIIDDPEFHTSPEHMTLVDDSLITLQALARFHRMTFTIPIIGITGSNGKTSTKELIRTVLAQKFNVLATEGNLNNHIGVPLTLLQLKDKHEVAIIEMGANRFKDIEELCAIAEPDYGIITNIGKAHLEGFGDFDGVLKTKRELYEAIERKQGLIIYNFDDEVLKHALPEGIATRCYGKNTLADVNGELLNLTPYIQMRWSTPSYESPILTTKMIGAYNFYNFLAAITFGVQFGVPEELINLAITTYAPSNKRSQLLETSSNLLIVDCYNANPSSMREALTSFQQISHPGTKICILGEMKELGSESHQEHQQVINLLEDLNLKAFLIGSGFSDFSSANILGFFDNTAEAASHFEHNQLAEHLVLLKGSRSVGLEALINHL